MSEEFKGTTENILSEFDNKIKELDLISYKVQLINTIKITCPDYFRDEWLIEKFLGKEYLKEYKKNTKNKQ